MQFIPVRSKHPTTTIRPQYTWQVATLNEYSLFKLYRDEELMANLRLPIGDGAPDVLLKLGKQAYYFQDRSSFFGGQLLLIDKRSDQRLAIIEKNGYRPSEGIIRLQGQHFGWKIARQVNQRLLLMDESRRGLFSYQYSAEAVRLLITKSGRMHPQLPLLLSMGLYLLPLWHRQEP